MGRLLATLATGAALATASPVLARPCTTSDVAGLWELVEIRAEEPGVRAVYDLTPYEYLRINPAMDFGYAASPRKLPVERADQIVSAAAAALGAPLSVDLPRPGLLFVLRNGTQPIQGFSCAIADAPSESAVKGDMIWTELPGMPKLRRVQRRMQGNQPN